MTDRVIGGSAIPVHVINGSGDTASRPATPTIGQTYFDTTLGIPVWYDGTNWINAMGTIV